MTIGSDSSDDDAESESDDGVTTFPQLQDVTDVNVKNMSSSAEGQDSVLKQKMATEITGTVLRARLLEGRRGSANESRTEARVVHSLSHNSREQEEEERVRSKSGFTPVSRRQSYPYPRQPMPETKTQSKAGVREELSAFQAVPQNLQQARAFRKISFSSADTDHEHSFLHSVMSTISFPTPAPSQEVVIPG
jgi:hypothetical protein